RGRSLAASARCRRRCAGHSNARSTCCAAGPAASRRWRAECEANTPRADSALAPVIGRRHRDGARLQRSTDSPRDRLDGVARIAVVRPSAIGNFAFALPALAAIRAAYPHAHIVYLGRRWHREFLDGRPGPIDGTLELPSIPGVGAPPGAACDPERLDAFVETMQARHFDLALQWYGGGGYANPFVRRLGPRCTAGLRAERSEERRVGKGWEGRRAPKA